MSIVPNANPFEDSPFTALSTSSLSRDASCLSGQFQWQETAEAHVLKADVPGLRKEEVQVEVEDGRVLHVSGERTVQTEDNSHACHRLQRSSSKFKKCFTLPHNAQPDHVMASIDDGVLTITLPKTNHSNAISN